MATLEPLLKWIRGRKHRHKNAHAPVASVTILPEVTSQRLEVSPCQCRASMKLPPIPREARRLRTSVPRERLRESPAHIYEEIPYATASDRHYTAAGTAGTPPGDQVEEYLAPSDEKSRNLRRLLLKTASSLSSKVVLKDTCSYSNVSPLSALGLEKASFTRCTKCQRPHGVYNSTVYEHDHSASGSPDIITFDRCHSSPALDDHDWGHTLDDRPRAQKEPPAQRSYSICDLREIVRENNKEHYDVTDDDTTQIIFSQGGRKGVQNVSSAFRVVARGQRTIHSSLRKQRRAKMPGAKDEYEFHLSKVKQNLKLETDVYAMAKVKVGDDRSAGSDYEHIASLPERPLEAPAGDAHAQRMRNVTKSLQERVTALKGTRSARPPCLRRVKPDARRHSVPGQMVAMTTDAEDYEIPVSSGRQSSEPYDPLEPCSDIDLSDKLSCRATSYVKAGSASSCYGSFSTASLDTYYSSSMYGNHGNGAHFKHNPLLSDIMRRNHDRQNLFI